MGTYADFRDVAGVRVHIFIQYDDSAFDITEVFSDEEGPIKIDGITVQSGDEMPLSWQKTYNEQLEEAAKDIWGEAPMPQPYVPPINQLG